VDKKNNGDKEIQTAVGYVPLKVCNDDDDDDDDDDNNNNNNNKQKLWGEFISPTSLRKFHFTILQFDVVYTVHYLTVCI
jgi:hypothetical protein